MKGELIVNQAETAAAQREVDLSWLRASSEMAAMDHFSIQIVSITGGLPFKLVMNKADTVGDLKKTISQKVKVQKDKICLLYLDKELVEGSLEENNIVDGSTMKFVPRTATGIIAPTSEETAVIQAMESLSETEVKVKVHFMEINILHCSSKF